MHVTAVIVSKLRRGDIVLTKGHSGFRVHRLVLIDQDKNLFITRGDCGQQDDPPVRADQILGIVLAKEVRLGTKIVTANLNGFTGKLLQGAARAQYLRRQAPENDSPTHAEAASVSSARPFFLPLFCWRQILAPRLRSIPVPVRTPPPTSSGPAPRRSLSTTPPQPLQIVCCWLAFP